MSIRTRLALVLLVVGIVPLLVAAVSAYNALGQMQDLAIHHSQAALEEAGEKAIREQARAVAQQVQLYLNHHPEIDLSDTAALEANAELAAVAVQPVGQTGYTAVFDADGITHFHRDPQIVGMDMSTLADKLPQFWTIFAASLDGSPAEGYYDWQDPDGSIRPKFMAIVPVGHTPLRVAATTYIDEFSQPIQTLTAKLDDLAAFLRLGFGLIAILVGVAAVGAALVASAWLTAPIRAMATAAAQIRRGERITIQPSARRDELGILSRTLHAMTLQLQDTLGSLEEQVIARTRDLERRATQLATAADVGRAAVSILEPGALAHQVVELVRERFDFYYVGLFLLVSLDAVEYAVLEAGTGEAGRLMKEQGHGLAVGGQSMVGAACAQRQARIALDVGEEPIRFDNPLLPDTRSEMALPLVVGDRVLGALSVQSTQPAAFSGEDIAVLRLVADQVAVALDNARRFSEAASVLEVTSPIYRASGRLTAAMTTDEVADAIIASVAETGVDGCVVVEFEFSPADEPEALLYRGVWRRDREPQFKPGLRLPIAESPFPLEMVNTFWIVPDVEQDERLPASARQVFEATQARALANIPLHSGGRVFGQVVVLRVDPGPFPEAAVRLYESLSDQASVALERARLLEETQRRAARERRVSEITSRIRASTEVDTILQTAIRELGRALRASDGLIWLGPGDAPRASQSGGKGEEVWP